MINPYQKISQAAYYGNITKDFVKAVEAINYLSPESHNLPFEASNKSYSSFADFLVEKLAENLKRLYSNKRNKGGYHNLKADTKTLEEYQDNIYYLFNKILPTIKLSETPVKYDNLFFGNPYLATPETAILFLAFHEHITNKNETEHLTLLNKINLEKIDIAKTSKNFSSLGTRQAKVDFHKKIISTLPIKTINHIIENLQETPTGTFSALVLLSSIENNISINGDNKATLINLTATKHNNQNLETFLFDLFEKTANQSEIFFQDTNITKIKEPLFFIQNRLQTFFLSKIPPQKTNNPKVFYRHIDLITQGKKTIPLEFDITNQEFLIETASLIKNCKNRFDAMKYFLTNTINCQTRETFAHILADNIDIYDRLQPIFLKYKLNENLLDETNTEITTIKKYKI